MHRLCRRSAIGCVSLCVLLLPTPGQRVRAAEIEAGIAQADITPPVGGMTTGYSAAKPTVGVHDPLSARVGKNLADEVIRVLDRMAGTNGSSDALQAQSSQIKVADRWGGQQTMTLGVTALLINHEIGIMTMPGEPFHQFQVDFRAKATLPHAYLFAYACNGPYDWPAYLPDIESAARGGYGASDTTHAEVGTGAWLLNLGLAQIYTMQGRLKDKPQRQTQPAPGAVGPR